MCATCGCSQPADAVTIKRPRAHDHHHDHDHHHHGNTHDHSHSHSHDHGMNLELELEVEVLQKNNLLAERNRGYFLGKAITALNLVSSPGSGKTTLLESTIKRLNTQKKLYVIEGDQQTTNDADRIEQAGAEAIQINTGKGCHLDSHMILHALQELNPETGSLLFIENVGNLVCPGLFDLGESSRVVIISVTEGSDKPIKYPTMFETSQVCIINKMDLLPYVDFDVAKCKEYARRVNPTIDFIEVSATNGDGMDEWINWLTAQHK
jgi:hydrogenase nickel incorporation protein HypB